MTNQLKTINEVESKTYTFKDNSGTDIKVTRRQMFVGLNKYYKNKDWWKDLGFKNTKSILDDDITQLYANAYSLDTNKRGRKLSQIIDGDSDKLKASNSNFQDLTEIGKEAFNQIKDGIVDATIKYSFEFGKEWDHDSYTDKPVDRLNPDEFLRWLANTKKRLEKEIRITKELELENLYKDISMFWNSQDSIILDIVKRKVQGLLKRADIPYDFSNSVKNPTSFSAVLLDIQKKYPERFDKIKSKIKTNYNDRGLEWYINHPKETMLSYIETFYKSEIEDLYTLKSTLRSSKEQTRKNTLVLAPSFDADQAGYKGLIGKVYEDLLDLAFRVKLGIITPTSFNKKFNKESENPLFKSLVEAVDTKNLYRFNLSNFSKKVKLAEVMDKPNINRALMKLHCFNVVSIILSHFEINQKQILLRFNMLESIIAYYGNLDWIKDELKKENLSKVSDDEIENLYYKVIDVDRKSMNATNLAKFSNVGFQTKKWAPVDYILAGKPLSLKRQKIMKSIKIKSGGSISGGKGRDVGEKIKQKLIKNHLKNRDRYIRDQDLKDEFNTLITDVLFRNGHYLVIVTSTQVGIFDFSKIMNNIDIDSFQEISNFAVKTNSSSSMDNKLKIVFNTKSPVELTLYSLSTADKVLARLISGLAVRKGVKLEKLDFSSEIRNLIKGNSELINGKFQINIDFRKGKEKADLIFLLDGKANLTELDALESNKIIIPFDQWVNEQIIFI